MVSAAHGKPTDGTVFVVDDDAAMRDSLQALLEVRGFRTRCFESVAAFRACKPGLLPGCVVLDLNMPERNGLELVEALSAEGSRLRVIMLSGGFNDDFKARAMAAGATACIDKPFAPARLIEAVAAALPAGA